MARFRQWRDSLIKRLRIAKTWLRDGNPLWLWLAIAALLLGIPYMLPAGRLGVSAELADRVRWSGMLFQFAGLATVVCGLNRSRQLFDRPSLWRASAHWLGRVRHIFRRPKTVDISAALSAGLASVSANAVVSSAAPRGTIDERVTRLEAELKRLETKISKTDREIRHLEHKTSDRLDRERTQRTAQDRKISSQLETATIGGIQLEAAGVAYLFVGIFLASVPREAACLLQELGL